MILYHYLFLKTCQVKWFLKLGDVVIRRNGVYNGDGSELVVAYYLSTSPVHVPLTRIWRGSTVLSDHFPRYNFQVFFFHIAGSRAFQYTHISEFCISILCKRGKTDQGKYKTYKKSSFCCQSPCRFEKVKLPTCHFDTYNHWFIFIILLTVRVHESASHAKAWYVSFTAIIISINPWSNKKKNLICR